MSSIHIQDSERVEQLSHSDWKTVWFSFHGMRSPQKIHCTGEAWVNGDYRCFSDMGRGLTRFLSRFETRNWLVINGYTDVLSRIHFRKDLLSSVRDGPLAIYLFEPLDCCDLHTEGRWTPSSMDQVDFCSTELDSILAFRENHGGDLDIVVYTPDPGLREITERHPRYSSLKIRLFDLFFLQYVDFPRAYSEMTHSFTKTAICTNFRYEWFRELMVAFLRSRDYHHRCFVSFFHTHDEKIFSKFQVKGADWGMWDTIRDGIRLMQPELPYGLDISYPEAFPASQGFPDKNVGGFNIWRNALGPYYEGAFLSIVNEIRFLSFIPNITEKTLHPILHHRPFLLVGPPGTLRTAKNLGFQTFSEFWDESYDEELDHWRRFEKVFAVIDRIFALPDRTLREMLWEMTPLLLQNRINLFDLVERKMGEWMEDR